MDMPFSFENAVVRRQAGYFSPERLTTLKNIFETVCDEAAIPADARSDRDALATKILVAGETINSEMMLVFTAMQAALDSRRWRYSSISSTSMPCTAVLSAPFN